MLRKFKMAQDGSTSDTSPQQSLNKEHDVTKMPSKDHTSLGPELGDFDFNSFSLDDRRIPPPSSDHRDMTQSPPQSLEPQVQINHPSEQPSRRSFSWETPQPPPHSHLADPFRNASRDTETPEPERLWDSSGSIPATKTVPFRQHLVTHAATAAHLSHSAVVSSAGSHRSESPQMEQPDGAQRHTPQSSWDSTEHVTPEVTKAYPPLQYHHEPTSDENGALNAEPLYSRGASRGVFRSSQSASPASSIRGDQGITPDRFLSPLGGLANSLPPNARPSSSYSTLSLPDPGRGRDLSPNGSQRDLSARRSPDSRPVSYMDLLNAPYPQPAPAAVNFNNTHLQTAVGSNASLLSNRKTLEMYRANAKKTNDASVQYEFALFMINAANETGGNENDSPSRDLESPFVDNSTPGASRAALLKEARQILQKLADRSYPFAQYYLADGYASGLFDGKGKDDYDKAFPLFVSASKHGHAEAGYRAALCYEFGWGCRKDPAKAVPFYRFSASKNHPGAMIRLGKACLVGDLGLGNRYREGLKWLKRSSESADRQYNRAPYELGLLYETGYGEDIFLDEAYAAQLFTRAADLGHSEASYRMGDAYEHGKLGCPRDTALSVHFYNCAAQQGHPAAMMALCAWYIVGAEPVLSKDDSEAYQWAKQAAECGLAKAEYAVGYFTEMGIGCRRDTLEANQWYVRAADQGDERAKHRLDSIRSAASGDSPSPGPSGSGSAEASANVLTKGRKGSSALGGSGGKEEKDEKDCIVM